MKTTENFMAQLPFFKKHGSGQQAEKYNVECENGGGQLLVYDVMPGIKLALTEFNGDNLQFHHVELPEVMQINYCLEGRMGWMMKDGSCLYLGTGDLALHVMDCCAVSSFSLPLGFYKGISLFVDLKKLEIDPPEILSGLPISAQGWQEKFCPGGALTVLPGMAAINEVFASLARVGEKYRPAYFKLKAQELLLFLAMLGVNDIRPAESCENRHIETIKKLHARLTEHWQQRFTIDALAKEYLINPSLLKKVFKAVYGKPIAQYMKEYRMHKAAALLLKTEAGVAEIARLSGYTNQSKFAAAFKDVMQLAPADYRARYAAKQ